MLLRVHLRCQSRRRRRPHLKPRLQLVPGRSEANGGGIEKRARVDGRRCIALERSRTHAQAGRVGQQRRRHGRRRGADDGGDGGSSKRIRDLHRRRQPAEDAHATSLQRHGRDAGDVVQDRGEHVAAGAGDAGAVDGAKGRDRRHKVDLHLLERVEDVVMAARRALSARSREMRGPSSLEKTYGRYSRQMVGGVGYDGPPSIAIAGGASNR